MLGRSGPQAGSTVEIPRLADPRTRRGFSIDFWVRFRELTVGQTILDTRDESGQGIRVATTDRSTLAITLHDGRTDVTWDSDRGTHPGTLRVDQWQHMAVIVDGGPRLILFVVDGILNDGGAVRESGWCQFAPELGDVNGTRRVALGPTLLGEIGDLRVYNRALRVSEAVGNHCAGS